MVRPSVSVSDATSTTGRTRISSAPARLDHPPTRFRSKLSPLGHLDVAQVVGQVAKRHRAGRQVHQSRFAQRGIAQPDGAAGVGHVRAVIPTCPQWILGRRRTVQPGSRWPVAQVERGPSGRGRRDVVRRWRYRWTRVVLTGRPRPVGTTAGGGALLAGHRGLGPRTDRHRPDQRRPARVRRFGLRLRTVDPELIRLGRRDRPSIRGRHRGPARRHALDPVGVDHERAIGIGHEALPQCGQVGGGEPADPAPDDHGTVDRKLADRPAGGLVQHLARRQLDLPNWPGGRYLTQPGRHGQPRSGTVHRPAARPRNHASGRRVRTRDGRRVRASDGRRHVGQTGQGLGTRPDSRPPRHLFGRRMHTSRGRRHLTQPGRRGCKTADGRRHRTRAVHRRGVHPRDHAPRSRMRPTGRRPRIEPDRRDRTRTVHRRAVHPRDHAPRSRMRPTGGGGPASSRTGGTEPGPCTDPPSTRGTTDPGAGCTPPPAGGTVSTGGVSRPPNGPNDSPDGDRESTGPPASPGAMPRPPNGASVSPDGDRGSTRPPVSTGGYSPTERRRTESRRGVDRAQRPRARLARRWRGHPGGRRAEAR